MNVLLTVLLNLVHVRYRGTSNRSRGITAAIGSSTAGNPRLPRYSRRPHHHAALYFEPIAHRTNDLRALH